MLSDLFLLAASESSWPDRFDVAIIIGYVLVIVGVPLFGYVLMAVDIRAYYRRLRGALVVVSNYVVQMPAWVVMDAHRRRKAPACLAAFGLNFPCSEAELLESYRHLVKTSHPDLGGDRNEFLKLQQNFEQARLLVLSQVQGE